MRGDKGNLRVRLQLPRGDIALEYMHLGMVGREEVVVSRLTANTTRGVRHLRSRHLWINLRNGLRLARKDVTSPVGLMSVSLLSLKPSNWPLRRESVNGLAICSCAGIHIAIHGGS